MARAAAVTKSEQSTEMHRRQRCSGVMEDVAQTAIYMGNTGVKSCSDFVTEDSREKFLNNPSFDAL
jgi:hypothetical protein